MAPDEADGTGGDEPDAFDHTELEVIGRALADTGRGLVRFGSEYPYLDADEREVRRQRLGRILALMNSLLPQVDAAIKADQRKPIRSHERDAHLYHVDRLFRVFEPLAKRHRGRDED